MFEFLRRLFDVADFPARWHCGNWSIPHGWLHILSDAVIFSAYMAIPMLLAYAARKRKGALPRVLWYFVFFILFCGFTHLIEVVVFWHPIYRFAGLVKMATAGISVVTVLSLLPAIRQYFLLRSPQDLEEEISTRTKAMALQKATLTAVFESSSSGLVVVDNKSKVLLSNSAATNYLGTAIGNDIQQSDFRFLKDTSAVMKHAERPIVRAFASGVSVTNNKVIVQHPKTFETTVLMVSAKPIEQDGKQVGAVGTYVDISDQSKTTDDLYRSNKDLEQFAYAASHDLTEPLRQIENFSALLKDEYKDKFDETGNEYLDFVFDGATRMQALVSGLLAYTRLGMGDDPDTSPYLQTNTSKTIKETIVDLEAVIVENDASVTLNGDFPVVWADPSKFRQVIQNLISNGLKFQRDSGAVVQVRAESFSAYDRFSVKDDGIGIAPEHHQRIFKVFQRLHTNEEYQGTGLGLALCRRVVEGWGGKIWLESKVGEGTTFFFTVPKVKDL